MKDKYSLTLLLIQLSCLFGGVSILIQQNWYGLIPFIWGGLMFLGYKELSGSQPREEGIITLFGIRTPTRVRGLIMVLDWLPLDIVNVSIFNMQIEDRDIEIPKTKSIRVADGTRMIGVVSIAFQANLTDLDKFDDAKGMDGIFELVNDMLPAWLKDIAQVTGRNYQWMENNTILVASMLRAKLEDPNNSLGGIAELGVAIKKLEVLLQPMNDKIVDADQDAVVELLERQAEIADTVTINEQINKRLQAYQTWAGTDPTKIALIPEWKKIREEIIFERLGKDKKVTIIQGGRNVNLNTVGNTNQQGTP